MSAFLGLCIVGCSASGGGFGFKAEVFLTIGLFIYIYIYIYVYVYGTYTHTHVSTYGYTYLRFRALGVGMFGRQGSRTQTLNPKALSPKPTSRTALEGRGHWEEDSLNPKPSYVKTLDGFAIPESISEGASPSRTPESVITASA